MQINGRPDGRAERADDETIFTLLTHIIHTSYVTKHYIHTHTQTHDHTRGERKRETHTQGVFDGPVTFGYGTTSWLWLKENCVEWVSVNVNSAWDR